MALNEQMKEAIQADIADESSKKERIAKQIEALKDTGKFVAETAVESIPGVSEAIAAKNVSRDLKEGDYVGAGIETVAGLAGLAPAGGDIVAKGLRKFNKTRKAYKLFVKGEDGELYPLFVDANKPVKQGEFLEANFPDVAFKGKRKEGSQESFYVPTKGAKRTPTKYYLDNKEITKKEYEELGPNAKPFSKVIPGEKSKGTGDSIVIPDEETRKKLIDEGFITNRTKRTKDAPYGKVTAVAARPGWHASQAPVATHLGPQDLKVSKKEAEKLVAAGVTPEAIKRRGNQFYVKRRAEDQVFAEVDMADDVDYQSMLAKEGRSDINDRVPKGGSYRYSDGQADSDQWVVGGDMKVNRVLSREETRAMQKEMGVTDLPYRDEVETILGKKFAEGGMVMDDYLVAKTIDQTQDFYKGGMSKQMDLFEPVEGAFNEGGLMDEGGSVDPESGNDVPVGSTQEEVRDDIPAQLSEGEFVLPADVVRFHGLEKIMALRDEAKAGLARMEAMGQMGNSEEATIPDGIPFSMDDLEMEDDGVQDFAQGGVVQAQAGTFVMPQTNPTQASQFAGYQPQYTPYTPPPMPSGQTMAQQYTPAQQQAVPTITQQAPTFTGFTGSAAPSPGGYDETKTYVNDSGMEMQIPFKDGSPIYPIPEGYSLKGEAVKTAQTTTTTDTGTKTAQVQDSGGDDPSDPFAGKNTVRLGGEVYTGKSGFVGDGVKSRRTTGEIMNTQEYAVGTSSSATKPTSGIVAGIKDAFTGFTNQDQMTLTNRNGVTVAMSKDLYDEIIGDKFGVDRQKMLDNLFEQQVQVEKELGDGYSKDIDNQRARELAKDLGVEYKGQSAAELRSKAADIAKEKAKAAETAKEKPSQERPSQKEQAKAAGERRKAEAQAAAASLPKGYKIDTTGKSATEILNEVREQKAKKERDDATRAAEAARNYQYYDSSGDYQGPDPFGGTGVSSGTDFGGTGYETSTGEAMVAEGGLMNKEKLAKQMKQSGLASKK